MNILFIEPFYSGSHKTWLNQLQQHSQHKIDILTMDGRYWKWRMYGASYTMSKVFRDYQKPVDLIIVSDMLDLSTFISLSYKKLITYDTLPPIGIYFHENQLAYPWKDDSEDKSQNRDVHYGMMNYNSCLVADFIFFNSDYNRRSFFDELEFLLNRMPDYKHNTISELKSKSSILPIGISKPITLSSSSIQRDNTLHNYKVDLPLILWNHRLEHDKNPDDFFQTLIRLKQNGYLFQLALLGEINKKALKEYDRYLIQLEDRIVAQGYLSLKDYQFYLEVADIAPVTSNHDFFGISVMEAISYGCYPLLPNRLAYPDLYNIHQHPELFYEKKDQLYDKLVNLIININETKTKSYAHLAKSYYWDNLITTYDQTFLDLMEVNS